MVPIHFIKTDGQWRAHYEGSDILMRPQFSEGGTDFRSLNLKIGTAVIFSLDACGNVVEIKTADGSDLSDFIVPVRHGLYCEITLCSL